MRITKNIYLKFHVDNFLISTQACSANFKHALITAPPPHSTAAWWVKLDYQETITFVGDNLIYIVSYW